MVPLLPPLKDNKKIYIICEGSEEYDYLNYGGVSYRQNPTRTEAIRKISLSLPIHRPSKNGLDSEWP